MKVKIVFILVIIMTLAFFQTALGEPLKFDENLDDTISIKRSGGTICKVPLKKGPIRGEMRPDGNINVYYRDGSHSIVVLDKKNKPQRIEEYNNKNRNTKKVFIDDHGDFYSEESYGRNGKKIDLKKYELCKDGKVRVFKSWTIDKDENLVEKEYIRSDENNIQLHVCVTDKFGKNIIDKRYANGRLLQTVYYKNGKPDYIEYVNGKIYSFATYGDIHKETEDENYLSKLRDKFAGDLLALGDKEDKVSKKTDKPSGPSSTDEKTRDDTSSPEPEETDTGIVGTWEETTKSGEGTVTMRFTFNKDGTFESDTIVTVYGGGTSNDPARGKYEVKGNILKVWGQYDSAPTDFNFKVQGNKLYLAGSVFTRKY